MSRLVAFVCLWSLPIAGLARQAESAESFAATVAELDWPGVIDPVDPPRDVATLPPAQAGGTIDRAAVPSFLDGLAAAPGHDRPSQSPGRADPRPGTSPAPPPSALQRLRRLQVFRK